jgi:hypothetical protein
LIRNKITKPKHTKQQAVDQLLTQLPGMHHSELRQHWRDLFERDPSPSMRRNHMIPILAYRAQEKAFGGLKESTVRTLRELALGITSEARAAYNHALYLKPRARMMQAWADFIENAQKAGKILPFRVGAA